MLFQGQFIHTLKIFHIYLHQFYAYQNNIQNLVFYVQNESHDICQNLLLIAN